MSARLLFPVVSLLLLSAPFSPASIVPDKAPPRAQPFDPAAVRLLDGPFRDALLRDKAYVLSLDPDRLLYNFRVTAGLPTSAEPLDGWEKPDCELRGHSVGHYLSACALLYAATGDPELKKRAVYVVAQLDKCQAAMTSKGYGRGYLSAYPESLFDRVDRNQPVWAPYYTLHKIMAGLLDVYQYCDDREALAVLKRMAEWLRRRVDKLSTEQMQAALSNEHGGMNEVLANLYAVTGNRDYAVLARAFNHEAVLGPLAAGEDKLDGLHANTQIPKIIGAARQYELSADPRFRDIATNFWRYVALNRSFVIGGHSDKEHFFPTNEFSKHLSPETAETCNTYNMLKLTRHLFAWDPSAGYMDFYERGLYNHILASQDPDSGMMTYLVAMQSGCFKTYSTPLQSFWCCVGTGMENPGRYSEALYAHSADELFVNLFVASTVRWKQKGVNLRQETQFPDADTSVLAFECLAPTRFVLQVRHPAWAQTLSVRVNGTELLSTNPGSYFAVDRTWRTGDRVQLTFPMQLRLESLPGDPSQVAILYGPVVLAGELGTSNLPPNGQITRHQTDFVKLPVPPVPPFRGAADQLLAAVRPAGSPLKFSLRLAPDGPEIPLAPFFRVHHERYAIYWKLENRPPAAALTPEQRDFMNWRFGMFVHFNLGTAADNDWAGGYEDPALFHPAKLDCNQWADLAKETGMTYMVLTVKHTEGIALYDSAVTDHDITLFKNYKDGKGDIVREFVDACRSRGLKVGFYYCFPGDYSDTNHHNAPPPGKPNLHGLPPEAAGDYTAFMKKQLQELLTRYGPVDLLWIDQWNNPYTGKDWPDIFAFVKSLQPHCLVLGNNAHDLKDSDALSYEFPWAHQLPPATNTLPAEVCDTLQNGQRWFWMEIKQPADMQTAEQIVDRLKLCNSRKANYLLDVPPDPEGLISGPQLERLQDVAALLKSVPADAVPIP
ncbi:MAG: glycoside hydrolase family 127 protein [Verrucomicrobiota bacterium]